MDSTGAHTGIFNLEITCYTGGCPDQEVAITSSTDVLIVVPGGCQSIASFSLDVWAPSVFINVLPGNNGVVCAGSDLTLAVNNPVSSNYHWFTPNGLTIDGPSIVIADIDSSQAGLYRVSAFFSWYWPYGNGGCGGHGEQLITVNPAPTVQAILSGRDIILSAAGGVGPYSYAITGGHPLVNGRFQNLPVGYYVVTATDANGCTAPSNNQVVDVVEPSAAWSLTLTSNPGSGVFHLTCTDLLRLPLHLTLYDATGLLLSAFELTHPDLTMDLSDRPSGWYLLRIKDDTRIGALRLSIVR